MKDFVFFTLFILTVFSSCQNSKDDPSNQSDNNILFSAQVKPTKSTTPLVPGVIATVYAFKSGNNYPVNQGDYEALASGALTGVDDYIMYLPDGTYNFYTVSTNTSDMTESLYNNQVTNLQNNTDYLWAQNLNETVLNATKSVSVVLKHIACQININLIAGNGITINSIDSAYIQKPDSSGTINILTGVISQSPLSPDSTKMNITGTAVKTVLLPTSATSIPFYVYLKVNGENYSLPYSALINTPSGGFSSGNLYEYTAVINLENMIFSALNVYDWNTNDLTDNPIYPEE